MKTVGDSAPARPRRLRSNTPTHTDAVVAGLGGDRAAFGAGIVTGRSAAMPSATAGPPEFVSTAAKRSAPAMHAAGADAGSSAACYLDDPPEPAHPSAPRRGVAATCRPGLGGAPMRRTRRPPTMFPSTSALHPMP